MLNSTDTEHGLSSRPAGGPRLCELLVNARQQRGLTLQHIARETKIPLRHLAALEREDLSALPGGLYRRAEVRAYARAVGVDDRLALGCLERLEAPAPRVETPRPARPSARASTRVRVELFIGLGIVAAVVFGRILWERQRLRSPESRPAAVDFAGGAAVPAYSLAERTRADAPDLAVAPAPLPVAPLDAPVQAAHATPSAAAPAPIPPQPGTGARPDTIPREADDTSTELSIVTEPRGARVTVNGIGWGETPVTIRHLPPGRKQIRVALDGYDSVERIVQTNEGRSSVIIRLRQP
jgi:cytoskeletal protein RodZ